MMNFKLYILEGACVLLEVKLGDGGGRMQLGSAYRQTYKNAI